jgi:hypothetical protein
MGNGSFAILETWAQVQQHQMISTPAPTFDRYKRLKKRML